MKKIIAALLSLLLVSNIAVIVLLAQNNRLLKEYLGGEPGGSQISGNNGNSVELMYVAEDKYLSPPNDWFFNFEIQNTADENIFIYSLTFTDSYLDGGRGESLVTINDDPMLFENMMGPEFRTRPLVPGETLVWQDARLGEELSGRTYKFTFIGESGTEYTATFDYNLIMEFGGSQAPESNGNSKELIHVSEDKYLTPPNDWIFNFAIKNTTDENIFIYSLNFIDDDLEGGHGESFRTINDDPVLFEYMMGPEFKTKPLAPGEIMIWNDAHPGEFLKHRTYLFTFIGESGTEYTATYDYNLIMEIGENTGVSMNFENDGGKDLLTLRHDVDYEVEVFDKVFWVPASSLGESRFSNEEVFDMIGESPETKQGEAKTLYEALQFYQVGGFAASDDNVRIFENGVNWEHHKPGYYAVLTNSGCCATSANWLNYILKDDYDEVGFIATSQRDGSGHIYNYIKENGWYYFIDLTHYRTDWVATAIESGNMNDYYNSDFVLGNIHKTKTVEAFVNYVQQAFDDPPGMMFKYTAENCLAIDSPMQNGKVNIVYEAAPGVNIEVIFDDPNDSLGYYQTDPPKNRPKW